MASLCYSAIFAMPDARRLLIAVCAAAVCATIGVARAADDIANPPEDALPPLAPVLRVIPAQPEYAAPSPQELLKECEGKDFVACMREWRPPPPPPPPEPPKPTAEDEEKARQEEEARRAAAGPPPPLQPGAPREPAQGGPLVGKPPPPNPAADKATLDALSKAIRDAGLADKIKLPDAPSDGGVEMKLDDKKPIAPAKGGK